MKAKVFAAVLSLSAISVHSFAAPNTVQPPTKSQSIKKINLNTANADELAKSFKGIGKKRAESIVSYRQTHGEFKSIEDLSLVRGLGKSFVSHHLSELQEIFITK